MNSYNLGAWALVFYEIRDHDYRVLGVELGAVLASRKDRKDEKGRGAQSQSRQPIRICAEHGGLNMEPSTLVHSRVLKKNSAEGRKCATQAAAKDTRTDMFCSNMLGTRVGRSVGLSPEPKQKQFSKRTPKIKTLWLPDLPHVSR